MKKQGFTIIEVIIAVSLIAILAVTVVPLISKSISNNRYASNRTKAINAALSKIEELRGVDFTTLANQTFDVSEIRGTGTVTLNDKDWDENGSIDAKEQELKELLINVNWMESGQPKAIALPTYIAKNGINRK